ncbi:hypothetical protein LZZ85_03415 [Terrimonas sp. NA20]|uniref:Redox-active disulfide protein 2 n=1 Tax=Terrimonas ginsenosidimutans TaxID=2908004 RepID=A0ABS9KLW7_9BACT|nr:hypothetical protein [Terrimonas ginsenosidimutans]MCG2613308.1 hypothetical protein [Terrimonas ginsenosidimutans]
MAARKPAELSNEELIKNEKTLKASTYMLLGASVALLVIGIFLTFKQGFSFLVIIPTTFTPIIIMNANSLKEIKKEKEVRGLQ